MNRIARFLALITLLAGIGWGASDPSTDLSWLSLTSPANCNTVDNAIITAQQILGSGTGYGCLKTLIFPQFAAGAGWTTQITGFLPVQSATTGLVSGTFPGYVVEIRNGSGATQTNNGSKVLINSANGGCLGFWESTTGGAVKRADAAIDSGAAGRVNYTGLAVRGKCSGGSDTQVPGLGQGPMQLQIIAPNATALAQATGQLTYVYDGGTFQWQATVDPVDIFGAKQRWTAPLYQGGDYVTAFSVVNASATAQTVSIVLRDDNGNPIGSPQSTPSLDPGCGCNQWQQSAAGGYYAATVPDLFGNIGTATGSIEFDGSAGPIMVIVLRTVKNSLGSVPAK